MSTAKDWPEECIREAIETSAFRSPKAVDRIRGLLSGDGRQRPLSNSEVSNAAKSLIEDAGSSDDAKA
jgi:hypothetical protein